MSFVHLHLHSEYSLLDGACRVADIPRLAKEMGHTAVALTDHGNLYGAVAFYKACKAEGIKPIIGCEVYVAPRDRFAKDKQDAKYYHLVLLCKNEVGYRNLTQLVSKGFTEGFYYKPRIDMALLEKHHEGLIALSGCVAGQIPQLILGGDEGGAKNAALSMQELFGDDFYLEIQNHGLMEEATVREGILNLHRKLGIAMVATNDVHYPRRTDAQTQAILMCIQTNRQITDGRPVGFETDEYDYKSTAEMEKLFASYPGAVENTVSIADACQFDFDFQTRHLPLYPSTDGISANDRLRKLAEQGLAARLEAGELDLEHHTQDDYKFRMIYELMMIAKMGYSDYYLIVSDFVNYAKNKGIPVGPGRGSGAGSLVAYLIRITEIDSIRYDLLFERFLNPERVSMPDFDIDFCYERRDEVIQYVSEKYGADHVAQIAAFGTMAARAAIRDVGRAMALPYGEVDRVAKLVPHALNITIKQALESEANLKQLYENDRSAKELLDVAMALEGMPRHLTIHAAGIVITKEPLVHYLPLTTSADAVLTQFDMNTVAELGLLKFDFLALRYLTVISHTESEVIKKESDFSIENIPQDDADTFALLSSADTEGVFQLESSGMRRLLYSMQPRSVSDIMIAIALYRPGPMDSIPEFLKNRKDPSKITYPIPQMQEILSDTAGCIIYQEQVMQIFRKLAGYSFGRADLVRKAMSKKNAEVMEKERSGFIEGCVKNFIDRGDAEVVFDRMASFASYAFNKSHAAAYALLAYRSAYLKAHYRAEYMASLLSSTMGSQQKMAEYIADCSNHSISILPPNVNTGREGFSANNGNILFGLSAIKGIGQGLASAIVKERQAGQYQNIEDFVTRVSPLGLGRLQMTSLIYAGALDCFGIYRSRLMESIEPLLSRASAKNRQEMSGQTTLFGDTVAEPKAKLEFPNIPEFSMAELLKFEKEMTGMYLSGSMLSPYKNQIRKTPHIPIQNVLGAFNSENEAYGSIKDRQKVTVCAVITKIVQKTAKNGSKVRFLTLEDDLGAIEAICFDRADSNLSSLQVDAVGAFGGTVSAREEGEVKLLLESYAPLAQDTVIAQEKNEAERSAPRQKKLYLNVKGKDEKVVRQVEALLSIFPGSVKVYFFDGNYRSFDKGFALSEYLMAVIQDILGSENVVFR